jgi:hypothetical protein
VLIAALAVANAVTKSVVDQEWRPLLDRHFALGSNAELLEWVPVIGLGLLPRYAAVLMPAILLIRLRRPRPGWRRLARQPGAVACAAGTGALLFGAVVALVGMIINGYSVVPLESRAWPVIEARVPLAVFAAWLLLWRSGRWRRERSWIDRAGSILGAYWIALCAARWYLLLHG